MYDSTPAAGHIAITPDDDAELPGAVKSLFIGGAGTVNVVDHSGRDVSYTVDNVPFVIPICPMKVLEDGTSATNIIGLLG